MRINPARVLSHWGYNPEIRPWVTDDIIRRESWVTEDISPIVSVTKDITWQNKVMSHRVCNPVKWQPKPRTRTNRDPTGPTGNNHCLHKNFPEMLMIWAEIKSTPLFSTNGIWVTWHFIKVAPCSLQQVQICVA